MSVLSTPLQRSNKTYRQVRPEGLACDSSAHSLRVTEGSEDKAEVGHQDFPFRKTLEACSRIPQMTNHEHSPVFRLPSEVLAIIFRCLVLSHRDLHCRSFHGDDEEAQCGRAYAPQYPHLSQVCVRWREVVFSNRILWSSLTLTLSNETQFKCAAILETFLKYSSPLPFHLELTILHDTMPNFPESFHSLPRIETILFESIHSLRISALYLTLMPMSWLSPTHIGALSSLRELSWSYQLPSGVQSYCGLFNGYHPPLPQIEDEDPSVVDQRLFERLPSLNYLNVNRWYIPTLPEVQSQIAVLRLDNVDIETTVRFLRHNPQLVEFYFFGDDFALMPGAESAQENAVHLPHLRVFVWYCPSSCYNVGSDLLDLLRLPCVEKVVARLTEVPTPSSQDWDDDDELDIPCPPRRIVNFLKRLPATVTHLEISHVEKSVEPDQIISHLSNLVHLTLSAPVYCPLELRGRLKFISPFTEVFKDGHQIPFLNLSELIVYQNVPANNHLFQFPPSLMDLIDDQGRESPFHLILYNQWWVGERQNVGLEKRLWAAESEGRLKKSFIHSKKIRGIIPLG